MPTVKRERTARSVPNYPNTYGYEEITTQSEAPESSAEPAAPPRKFPYIPENILNPLLLVILNLSLSSAGTALAAQYIGDEISAVQTETPEEYWWYVVPGWKILKALSSWWGGFDGEFCVVSKHIHLKCVYTNYFSSSHGYESFDFPFTCSDDTFPRDLPSFTLSLCPRVDDCHIYPELGLADVPPPIESP